jgi:hypothetical protein
LQCGNFQVLSPLDFLAEFRAPSRSDGRHIPPKGAHLVRYYGWYSNKARGMRRKAAASNLPSPVLGRGAGGEGMVAGEGMAAGEGITRRASQTWAMLIKRVYEIDPLECAKCGGQMKVVAFIEPPQPDVIERILKHCGLWQAPRPPPRGRVTVYVPDDDGGGETAPFEGAGELTFVPDPDWDRPLPSSDVPWEMACDAYGDSFDASF